MNHKQLQRSTTTKPNWILRLGIGKQVDYNRWLLINSKQVHDNEIIISKNKWQVFCFCSISVWVWFMRMFFCCCCCCCCYRWFWSQGWVQFVINSEEFINFIAKNISIKRWPDSHLIGSVFVLFLVDFSFNWRILLRQTRISTASHSGSYGDSNNQCVVCSSFTIS